MLYGIIKDYYAIIMQTIHYKMNNLPEFKPDDIVRKIFTPLPIKFDIVYTYPPNTKKLGDYTSFYHNIQEYRGHPHYSIVLHIVKPDHEEEHYLVIVTGVSRQDWHDVNKENILLVKRDGNVFKNETYFSFDCENISFLPYNSKFFTEKSNSPIVGTLNPLYYQKINNSILKMEKVQNIINYLLITPRFMVEKTLWNDNDFFIQ